jgi:predicted phosphodiesterase
MSSSVGRKMKNRILRQITRSCVLASLVLMLTSCSFSGTPSPSLTSNTPTPKPSQSQKETALFVALGDFGSGDSNQAKVAKSIAEASPEWFLSLGDNVYSQAGYQALVGDYYGQFLNQSKFLPVTGNHDYREGIANYDSYFGTTKQTRYYKIALTEDVEIFVLDSQAAMDSARSMKKQKSWLSDQTRRSNAEFKIVVLHHPPFTSSVEHGPNKKFQWDFEALGITAVISGHAHLYERLTVGNVIYLVSGAGGRYLHNCGKLVTDDAICIDGKFGALYFTESGDSLLGQYRSSAGKILDSFSLDK